MIQHAVLITFKRDLDPEVLEDFLRGTDEIFADTPFKSVVHGSGLGAVPNGADWGYIGLLDSDDITVWREHQAHIRLRDRVSPLTEHVCHIQMSVEA